MKIQVELFTDLVANAVVALKIDGAVNDASLTDEAIAWAIRQEWEPIIDVFVKQLVRTAMKASDLADARTWAERALAGEPSAVTSALDGLDERRGAGTKLAIYRFAAEVIAAQYPRGTRPGEMVSDTQQNGLGL